MPNTVPNQRLIAIHRERAASDFLGIKNDNWQAAARDLGAHALMLYLYLASNADGFTLALSPAAIRQAVGMPQSTYRDQFTKLIDRGYLVQRGDSNTYDFYETPQCATHTEKDDTASGYDFTADAFAAPQAVNNDTAEDREININITEKKLRRSVVHLLSKAKTPSTKQAEKYKKTLDFKLNRPSKNGQ